MPHVAEPALAGKGLEGGPVGGALQSGGQVGDLGGDSSSGDEGTKALGKTGVGKLYGPMASSAQEGDPAYAKEREGIIPWPQVLNKNGTRI